MNRRTVLRATGTALVGLTAGCLGGDGTEEETFNLEVTDQEFGPDDEGILTVWVTVTNPDNEAQSGTIYLTTEVEEAEPTVRTRAVSLDAHETKEVTFEFEAVYDELTHFEMDVRLEPPTVAE